MWGHELDRAGSGWGQLAGTCGCSNEPSGSIKCGEFFEQLKLFSFSRRTVLCAVSK